MNSLWSNAANWTPNIVPSSSTVAVFNGTTNNANCTFDSSVLAANRVVAGLLTINVYTATLSINAYTLTVSSLSGDSTTGFQWGSGNISQGAAGNTLIITGGGDATNNVWQGGSIYSPMAVQSNIWLNGGSTLQITGSANQLGDNIIIGQDGNGGSTLQFHNQTGTLALTLNAGIQVSYTTSDFGANQLIFDTDVTQVGIATTAISTSCNDSFIDNSGIITRSNSGTLTCAVPILNEAESTTLLDLKSNLSDTVTSTTKTAGYSIDQAGGITRLENGKTLTVTSYLLAGGTLQTYGSSQATISGAVSITGGTIDVSADNHSSYGSLAFSNTVTWSGGTFQAYVNGGNASQQTQLVFNSAPVFSTGGHVAVNVIGALTSGLTWTLMTYPSEIGSLTFDSGALFNMTTGATALTVTSL